MDRTMPPKPEPGMSSYDYSGRLDWYTGSQMDAYAISYAAALRAENERLRGALREVVDVLGPDPATCTTNTCEGCQFEMRAAFTAARAALGEGQ